MTYILKHNGEKEEATLSMKEIESNAQLFLTAGSESTATMLSTTTYMLLKTPRVIPKLKDEVRGRWKSYGDITLEEVNKAPYLLAVLSEGQRYFPPVPAGFERRVGKDPELFVRERLMGDPKYADDNRTAYQPFTFGPRNCLGKNLAYAETRLIMAKIIWLFDLELDPKSANWMDDCEVKTLWVKSELSVWVKEVVRP